MVLLRKLPAASCLHWISRKQSAGLTSTLESKSVYSVGRLEVMRRRSHELRFSIFNAYYTNQQQRIKNIWIAGRTNEAIRRWRPRVLGTCKSKRARIIWSSEPVGACRPGQMAVHLSAHPACDRKCSPVARMWSVSAPGPHQLAHQASCLPGNVWATGFASGALCFYRTRLCFSVSLSVCLFSWLLLMTKQSPRGINILPQEVRELEKQNN